MTNTQFAQLMGELRLLRAVLERNEAKADVDDANVEAMRRNDDYVAARTLASEAPCAPLAGTPAHKQGKRGGRR